MFYQLFVTTLFGSLLTLQVLAAPKEKPVTHYVAIAAANTINTLGTVDAYVKWLSHFAPASDIEKLKAEFTKHGINMGDKFPKMNYKNDKAYFDKNSGIVFGTDSVTIAGKKLVLTKKPIHELFSDICVQIQCKKTTADFSFFSKAYAKFNWGNALLGAVGVGALAKLITGDTEAAWKGALVGGIGGGFINFENHRSCNYGGKKCEVTCEGGDYFTDRPEPRPYFDQPARSGRVRIYSSTTRHAYGNGYKPCDQASQQSRDQLAYDIQNGGFGTPFYPSPGGGQDQLQQDIGGATPTYSDTTNGEKKRGTTSLPAKKK